MKYILTISILIGLSIPQEGSAQEARGGSVRDIASDQPIGGAAIRSLKTRLSTSTDKNGMFRLKTDARDTLIVQCLGYGSDTVVVGGQGPLDLYLTPVHRQIDEVLVNSGYQELSAKEITGAVQVLSRSDLQRQAGANILERLGNVATGVLFKTSEASNPQQKLGLSIRGPSTINGPVDPLVVLDGFIYEGDISNIDPNSIESISLLKDAAASAIWGARAGNGVIVLSSKNGSAQHRKVDVTFEHSSGFQRKSNWGSLFQVPTPEFIATEKMLFDKGYYDTQIGRNPEMALTPAIEVLLARREGRISASDSAATIDKLLAQDGQRNFAEHFQAAPHLGQSFVNLSGKAEKMTYNVGAGHTSTATESRAKGDKFNFYMGNNYRPIERLDVGINLTYSQNTNHSGMPAYNQLSFGGKAVPYMAFMDDDGIPIAFDTRYRKAFMDDFHTGKLLDWNYYPLTDHAHSKTRSTTTDIFVSIRSGYQLFPFLKLLLGVQYQKESQHSAVTHDKESFYARNMINAFTEIDPTTGALIYRVPLGGVDIQDRADRNAYTARGQANFSKYFDKHYINGIVGAEMRENGSRGSAQTLYGYSDDPLRSTAVDHVTRFRTLPVGASSVILGSPSLSRRLNRFISTYANIAYLYHGRYGMSASIRKDGGNIFGVHANDRWNPFWSVGLSWNMAQERFLAQGVFSTLKLRSTLGYSGNVDLGKTPLPIAENISGRFTDFPALVISSLNDPGLRWEKVRTLNVGVDFALKSGVISGAVDAFVKNGVDLYGLSLYDYTAWGKSGTITTNTASMRGAGIEANLLFDLIRTRKFSWSSNLLFNYNRNKTTDYYHSGLVGITSFLGDGSRITPLVGKPLNAIAGYTWAGLDAAGNPQGLLEGAPSVDYVKIREEANQKGEDGGNIRFLGSAVPQVYGALIHTLSYRRVSLSVNVSYRSDYYFKDPVTSYSQFFKSGIAYRDFEDRWQGSGDERNTDVPAMAYPANEERDSFYAVADINMHKGDHIRLEYVNLSWTPTFAYRNKQMNGSLFVNVKNLGRLWSVNGAGVDPDYAGQLGPLRTVTLGVRLKL